MMGTEKKVFRIGVFVWFGFCCSLNLVELMIVEQRRTWYRVNSLCSDFVIVAGT